MPIRISLPKRLLVLGLSFVLVAPVFSQEQEQDKDSAGIIVSGKAGSKDVGLPLYPGSKPAQDGSTDSQAARLGLWGGGSGFKMAVLMMESSDSVDKVAAFYKKALAHYGKVLDCGNPPSPADQKDFDALTCGDDHPAKGGSLFKSGTKEKQHIVSIRPNGKGSLYQLVALNAWNSEPKH